MQEIRYQICFLKKSQLPQRNTNPQILNKKKQNKVLQSNISEDTNKNNKNERKT